MDQLKATQELTTTVAQLASANNQLVQINAHLTQRLAHMEAGVRLHDERARYTGETALNIGGPGS